MNRLLIIAQHRIYFVQSKPYKVKSNFGSLAHRYSGFSSADRLYHLRMPHANCECVSRKLDQLVRT